MLPVGIKELEQTSDKKTTVGHLVQNRFRQDWDCMYTCILQKAKNQLMYNYDDYN